MMNKKMVKLSGLTLLNEMLDSMILKGSTVSSVTLDGKLIQVRSVLVTPQLAESLLVERNAHNRKVTKSNIKNLSKFMTNGSWKFNGETIIFDEHGNLDNGQHRLYSIIASNTSQIMLIVTGVEETSFDTLDMGAKRSGSDIFSINDIKNETLAAATVKFIWAFRNGKYSSNRNTVRTLANHEIVDYYWSLPNIDESIRLVSQLKNNGQKLITPSTLAGLHYLFCEIDKDLADEFVNQLYIGTNISEGSPITPLRNKLFRTKVDRNYILNGYELLTNISFVWNKFKKGKTCKSIRIPDNYVIDLNE